MFKDSVNSRTYVIIHVDDANLRIWGHKCRLSEQDVWIAGHPATPLKTNIKR